MRCLAGWGSVGTNPHLPQAALGFFPDGHIVGLCYLLWGMANKDMILS